MQDYSLFHTDDTVSTLKRLRYGDQVVDTSTFFVPVEDHRTLPATNDQDDEKKVFSTRILSHIAPVRAQMLGGSKWFKREAKLLAEYAAMEDAAAKKLKQIVEHQKSKLIQEKGKMFKDKMPRNWNATMALIQFMEEVSHLKIKFAECFTAEVVRNLEEGVKENQNKVKSVDKEIQLGVEQLTNAVDKMNSMKIKTLAAIQECEPEKTKYETKTGKIPVIKKGNSFLSVFSAGSSVEKVNSFKKQYEASIENTNILKIKWQNEILPSLQDQVEALERHRLKLTQTLGIKAATLIAKMHKEVMLMSDFFLDHCSKLNTTNDINSFADSV